MGGPISIHALHEESDQHRQYSAQAQLISIHALHEESDHGAYLSLSQWLFQSTLSMRRATKLISGTLIPAVISIHALHEESDRIARMPVVRAPVISIHALHEESDQAKQRMQEEQEISIHALHEESDNFVNVLERDYRTYFNPRSP